MGIEEGGYLVLGNSQFLAVGVDGLEQPDWALIMGVEMCGRMQKKWMMSADGLVCPPLEYLQCCLMSASHRRVSGLWADRARVTIASCWETARPRACMKCQRGGREVEVSAMKGKGKGCQIWGGTHHTLGAKGILHCRYTSIEVNRQVVHLCRR